MIGETADRLARQVAFIAEVDRLKTVLRNTRLTDGSRAENSAEHSWHLALMAVLLAEHAPPDVDISHAVRLLLVHDIVEIDAGDTDCYDADGYATKAAREQSAAARLFGLLPPEQAAEFRALWEEFEACSTAEAQYANALDRLQPMLLVRHVTHRDWSLRATTREQVLQRMAPVEHGAPGLWPIVTGIIEEAFTTGRTGRID
ncbi:MAG TPA: HD domain-containing protein [Longimicrobiales bacterium]